VRVLCMGMCMHAHVCTCVHACVHVNACMCVLCLYKADVLIATGGFEVGVKGGFHLTVC